MPSADRNGIHSAFARFQLVIVKIRVEIPVRGKNKGGEAKWFGGTAGRIAMRPATGIVAGCALINRLSPSSFPKAWKPPSPPAWEANTDRGAALAARCPAHHFLRSFR
jgi:hypothetical protein